jgi:fructose/tagatose bisphosphate aldolase
MSREIVIHSLAHARAALAAAAALRLPVIVASAPGAAAQAGPAWFKAVIEEARAAYPDVKVTAILDCGDEPGAVMAALRAGLTQLRFNGAPETREKLAAMGAIFIEPQPADATFDLLDVGEPEAACHAFLARH